MKPGDDLKIPLLEDVLDLGIPCNIDMKNFNQELMEETYKIIIKKGA